MAYAELILSTTNWNVKDKVTFGIIKILMGKD
jgi:hypothetical protein